MLMLRNSNTCDMHILSLSSVLSIHNKDNSGQNHFKFSTVVVEKGTPGYVGIASSFFFKLAYLRYLVS